MAIRLLVFALFVGLMQAASPTPPPNILVVLTDDQDLRLGSLQAQPYLREKILPTATNMSNFFVHTPICCPSRSTLVTGRFVHNNKVANNSAGGCMRMNSSRVDNPAFWHNSFIRTLHTRGWTTGVFGKLLNKMNSYGCDGSDTVADGVDRMKVMCGANFYNQQWADFTVAANGTVSGSLHKTGSAPEDYTTTMIGNASLAWIKEVVASNKAAAAEGRAGDHKPFFAYLGPHAPHLPSTPPPYAVDPAIAEIPVPVDDHYYGVLAKDKHSFLAIEPNINQADAKQIATEHTHRLQSLVAVDDVVRQVAEFLIEADEWDNTYFLYTSDHGYNLGQFRVDSHKTQVYDHNLRVPMIIKAPKAFAGTAPRDLPLVTSMVDLGPTILELAAGGNDPASVPGTMDGASFAPFLTGQQQQQQQQPRKWKTAALVEYLSIRPKDTVSLSAMACTPTTTALTPLDEDAAAAIIDAYGYSEAHVGRDGKPHLCEQIVRPQTHYHDGPNNTFSALRIIDPAQGMDLLYAEFADVNNPLAWDFAPDQLNFFELYNVTEDYYMRHNIYSTAPADLKKRLHDRLQTTSKCRGAAQCAETLN